MIGTEDSPGQTPPRGSGTDDRRDLAPPILSGLAGLAVAAGLFAWNAYPGELAARFWVVAMDLGLLVAALLWRLAGSDEVRADRRPAVSWRSLGAATMVTLFRGGLICLIGGFIFMPRAVGILAWVPGALYTAAAIADRYDGILARHRGQVTALGGRLDVEIDALGLLIAPLVAVRWGRLPAWYLLLGAAYYLFRGGLWARRRLSWRVFPERLRPYPAARLFAGLNMAVCAVALFPVLPAWMTGTVATAAMIPTIGLFIRDWSIVIGRRPGPESLAPSSPPRATSGGGDGSPVPPPPS